MYCLISCSKPDCSDGGATLFLIGADHGYYEKEKKTVVMIAHTLSIVKNADQILVMGDGGISESGTHEELLAKGGKYAAMWNAEQKISA